MLPNGEKSNHSATRAFALNQASFWMSFCIFIGYAAVYLQSLGYSNASLGAIMAVGNLLGALLGPALAARIDRDARVTAEKLTPPVLALQAAALVVLTLFPAKGNATTVAFVLYIAFGTSVNSLNLKLYDDAVYRGAHIDYGFARGFGSLAFVLVSSLLGVIVERTSARVIPLAGILLCAVQFAAFCLMKRSLPAASAGRGAAGGGVSMAVFARNNRRFCVLLLGTAIIFFSHNTVANFLINVTRNVGGDTGTMGIVNGFMAAVEIPVMLLFTRLLGKKSMSALLRVSFVFFALKSAAIAAAPSIPALIAVFLLQAPSFALYTSAIVPYVSRHVAHEDSAKAQSLAFTMTTAGSMLASVISGRLYDVLTVTQTLWIACAACVVGVLVSLLGTETDRADG